jgi:hypothetical protein
MTTTGITEDTTISNTIKSPIHLPIPVTTHVVVIKSDGVVVVVVVVLEIFGTAKRKAILK